MRFILFPYPPMGVLAGMPAHAQKARPADQQQIAALMDLRKQPPGIKGEYSISAS